MCGEDHTSSVDCLCLRGHKDVPEVRKAVKVSRRPDPEVRTPEMVFEATDEIPLRRQRLWDAVTQVVPSLVCKFCRCPASNLRLVSRPCWMQAPEFPLVPPSAPSWAMVWAVRDPSCLGGQPTFSCPQAPSSGVQL